MGLLTKDEVYAFIDDQQREYKRQMDRCVANDQSVGWVFYNAQYCAMTDLKLKIANG